MSAERRRARRARLRWLLANPAEHQIAARQDVDPEPEPAPPSSMSRRRALASLLGGAALTAAATRAAAQGKEPRPAPKPRVRARKRKWGMAIDLDRCTACNACVIACEQENNVPTFSASDRYEGARIEWMSVVWREPERLGSLPMALPTPCQHCETAPCVKVCPVGATYKDEEGITMQVYDRCIGCRYCMVACPYSRRFFNWEQPKWEGTLVQLLNPDVSTRPAGVVEKCTFCHHRIQRAREEAAARGGELQDVDLHYLTACASACPAKAITFGDLGDDRSEVSRKARSPRAERLHEHLGTEPRVFYLKKDER